MHRFQSQPETGRQMRRQQIRPDRPGTSSAGRKTRRHGCDCVRAIGPPGDRRRALARTRSGLRRFLVASHQGTRVPTIPPSDQRIRTAPLTPGSQDGDIPVARLPPARRLVAEAGGSLAGDHQPWPGPFVKPFGVGGPAAMVGCEHHFRRWLRAGQGDQRCRARIARDHPSKACGARRGRRRARCCGRCRRRGIPAGGRMPDRQGNVAIFQESGAVTD